MTNPIDNYGSGTGAWAWTIQREMDNLHRLIEDRYTELSSRLDKVVGSAEYAADNRTRESQRTDLLERISNLDEDVEDFRREIYDKIDDLRREFDADIEKVASILEMEKKNREETVLREKLENAQAQENARAARAEKRKWIIASILIPVLVALIPIIQALK